MNTKKIKKKLIIKANNLKSMKKLFIGLLATLAIAIIAIPAYANFKKLIVVNPNGETVYQDEDGNLFGRMEEQILGGMSVKAVDVFGTRTGTSTTNVDFNVAATGGNSASTTYPVYIGDDIDEATLFVYVDSASSTANLTMSFLASNDPTCETSGATGIHWFDAGDNLKNKVHSTSLGSTSTLAWVNPSAGTGRQIIFENLNSKCLAFDVSGSSTEAWAELKTKQR